MPLTALPTHGAPLMFVNRTGESKAFAAGLVEHRRRMDAEEISWHQLQNVIVFYGIGGVGKTELSLQLAEWIEGRPCPSSWGVPPVGAVSATVRWDLNASHGQADPLALLLQLRRGLSQVRRIWPAFDLPFAAFTQQARPGQRIILTRKNEQALSVQDVLSGLLSDAATAADIAGGGGGAAAATGLGHMLVSKAVNGSRARSAFSEFDGLKSLVEDCERYSGDAEEGVQLCVRILEMLSLTIDRMPADERPLIVVFVDTFERVQNSREAEGETALNWLVASSPYLFFVVTGRDSLRWHEEQQIHLVCRGSAMWPGLLLDGTPEHEPRQHLVGNLSEADTLDYLQRALASVGAKVESRVLPALYGLTHGWPLHLDAIVEVARDRASCGTLTLEDLGGRFPVLVNRLMRGFPDDERTAFNAACLLPYFDEQLVAHAGQVSVGTVRRLVQRSVVLPDASPVYTHRIHDELRSVVREAGGDVNSGWAEQDWERHARLALDEARNRFDTALLEGQDRPAVLALALAINIAVENQVWDKRLIDDVRRSPAVRGLSALVPAAASDDAPAEVRAFIAYIRAHGQPTSDENIEVFRQLGESQTGVSESAQVWHGYRLRELGRAEEALKVFETLVARGTERPALYRVQRVMTLAIDRRHRAAIAAAGELPPEAREAVEFLVRAREGIHTGFPEVYERRMARATSRRFQVELTGSWLRSKHLLGEASAKDVRRVRDEAETVGHAGAVRKAIAVWGEMNLFNDDIGAQVEQELRERRSDSVAHSALAHFLALRAWALESEELLHRARQETLTEEYRNGAWIPVEILLKEMGHEVPSPHVQWVDRESKLSPSWWCSAVADQVPLRA